MHYKVVHTGGQHQDEGEEGGIVVLNGAVGGCVALVEKVTFRQHLHWEGKNIPGRGNGSPACSMCGARNFEDIDE